MRYFPSLWFLKNQKKIKNHSLNTFKGKVCSQCKGFELVTIADFACSSFPLSQDFQAKLFYCAETVLGVFICGLKLRKQLQLLSVQCMGDGLLEGRFQPCSW